MNNDELNERYRAEGWGVLADWAGFEPAETESSARQAFRFAWEHIVEREAELIFLREYGGEAAELWAGAPQDLWREKSRAAIRKEMSDE